MKKAVCIISGGMDSATAAKIKKDEGYALVAVHFNYGQRTQAKELEFFQRSKKSDKKLVELKLLAKFVIY